MRRWRAVVVCFLSLLTNQSYGQLPLNYSGDPTEVRSWSDAAKAFRVEAQLLKVVDGVVHLKRKDNAKVIQVAFDKLSLDDIAYVKSLATTAGSGPRLTVVAADKLESAAKRQRTA